MSQHLVTTETVTAEVVSVPTYWWWPSPEPVGLLFREEEILLVIHDLERGDPWVSVYRADPEECVTFTKIDFPRELYEAARHALQGLERLKEVVPLVRTAIGVEER